MELPDRDDRDDEAAALLLLLLTRYRDELMQHLGQPPDTNRVPSDFWRRVEAEMSDNLASLLLLTFAASAQMHGADSPELQTSAANAGVAWATSHAQVVAIGFTHSSQRMLARRSDEWLRDTLSGNPPTTDDIMADVSKILGEARAERLASDVVTSAQTAGGEWAVAATSGVSEHDTWFTVADEKVCPVCEPLDGATRSAWQTAHPNGPPAHPKCRCWITYESLKGTP